MPPTENSTAAAKAAAKAAKAAAAKAARDAAAAAASATTESTDEVSNVEMSSISYQLAQKGFDEDQIEKLTRAGIEQNSLPATGKFFFDIEKHASVNEDQPEMNHIRIGVVGSDDTISLSRIKIQAPRLDQPVKFRQWEKEGRSGWMLQGNPVNPHFSKFSQVQLVEYLNGKSFEAEEVDVNVLPFKEDGYTSEPKETDVVMKTAYKIRLS